MISRSLSPLYKAHRLPLHQCFLISSVEQISWHWLYPESVALRGRVLESRSPAVYPVGSGFESCSIVTYSPAVSSTRCRACFRGLLPPDAVSFLHSSEGPLLCPDPRRWLVPDVSLCFRYDRSTERTQRPTCRLQQPYGQPQQQQWVSQFTQAYVYKKHWFMVLAIIKTQ